jgi:hypothetical protein
MVPELDAIAKFRLCPSIVANNQGERVAYCLNSGNVDDRNAAPQLTKTSWGKWFVDGGYLAQPLFEQRLAQGLQLITLICKNIPNRLMSLPDNLLARKRSLIEAINDQLKNISQQVIK